MALGEGGGRSPATLFKRTRPSLRGALEWCGGAVPKLGASPSRARAPRRLGLRTRAATDREQTSRVRARPRLEAALRRTVGTAARLATRVTGSPSASPPGTPGTAESWVRSPGRGHQACVPAQSRVGERLCRLRASGRVPPKAARVPSARGKGRPGGTPWASRCYLSCARRLDTPSGLE